MCGIVGTISKNHAIDRAAFEKLTDSLSHRGPDASASYLHHNIALGHTRLKIIDLTDHSNQPMVSECDNFVLIYNGEIYNYIELKTQLLDQGFQFRTQSDTEVLLAAYQHWGADLCEHLNGMWAFVILDKRKNVLFGSRDRFGIKPLYYSFNDKGFHFASEIRSLLHWGVSSRANQHVVHHHLLTGFMDHDEDTFFSEVKRLIPGYNFTYDCTHHEFSLKKYYDLGHVLSKPSNAAQDHLETFEYLFHDSVRLRMRSDVEVGTCLSGGMDSSSIASVASCLLKAHHPQSRITAFTAVSSEPRNDESPFARAVADRHGMRSVHVTPTYEDMLAHLDDIVYTQEEPFGGPSIVMQYLLMKKIRETGVKVLLDGQGGDELLLGYPRYSAAYLSESFADRGLISTLIRASHYIKQNTGQSVKSLSKFVIASKSAQARFVIHKQNMPFFNESLLLPDYLQHYEKAATSPIALQILECTSTNLPRLLRFEDKNSMAFGIEARLPFLDHRLLEYAISLPLDYKIRKGWTKWILRKTMEKHLPPEITWRKNKFGFEAPDKIWLNTHQGEMQSVVLKSPLIKSMTNAEQLASRFPKLGLKTQWRIYSVALWEKRMGVV